MARVSTSRIFAVEAARMTRIATETPTAVRRAVATLVRSLPVQARRDIQDEYNLGSKRIAKDLTAKSGDGYVDLIGFRRQIGLLQYKARWGGATKAGVRKKGSLRGVAPVTARIKAKGATETFPGAFIARGLNGNLQVFYRSGSARRMQRGRSAGRSKQPLTVIYEGSIAEYLAPADRRDRLGGFARTKLRDELVRITGRTDL